jgi:hypothetical protein
MAVVMYNDSGDLQAPKEQMNESRNYHSHVSLFRHRPGMC